MRIRLLRLIIGLFLIFNITIFVFGYNIIDNKLKSNNEYIILKQDEFLRKEENILEKLDVLAESKKDLNTNLKENQNKINLLKAKLNNSLMNFNSIEEEKIFYDKELLEQENKKSLLSEDLILLQKKLDQQKISEAQKLIQKSVVRKTRSS